MRMWNDQVNVLPFNFHIFRLVVDDSSLYPGPKHALRIIYANPRIRIMITSFPTFRLVVAAVMDLH